MKRRRLKQRVMCLWFPRWPLQRVRLARPALKRCELSLYNQQRGALRLIASDRYAVGTPLAEVVGGKVEQHDPHADQEALLDLAAWCEQFSPTVGMEPPDCLYLDVTGLDHLAGSEELLIKQISRSIHRRGLIARAAVAATIGVAWGVSHYDSASWSLVRDEAVFRSLPIEALRLGDEVEVLAELGVTKIKQLLAIPRDALASRFGPQLLHRINQAFGEEPEPIL
jgi:protein ImuB